MNKVIRYAAIALGAYAGYYAVQRVMGTGNGPTIDALATGLQDHLKKQGDYDAYRARLDAAPNAAERQRLALELSRRGLARLSLEDMADRDRILLHLDSIADVAQCAQRFKGSLDPAGMKAFLSRLEPAQFDRWAEISAHAVSAELHATTPLSAPTTEEIGLAFSNVKRPMTTPDENRLNTVLQNFATATPDDLCWASKHLMGTALALPEPPRSSVLSTFTKLEAGLQ